MINRDFSYDPKWIADGLRHNGWKSTMPAAHARGIADRYGLTIDFNEAEEPWTLAQVSEIVAEHLNQKVGRRR